MPSRPQLAPSQLRPRIQVQAKPKRRPRKKLRPKTKQKAKLKKKAKQAGTTKSLRMPSLWGRRRKQAGREGKEGHFCEGRRRDCGLQQLRCGPGVVVLLHRHSEADVCLERKGPDRGRRSRRRSQSGAAARRPGKIGIRFRRCSVRGEPLPAADSGARGTAAAGASQSSGRPHETGHPGNRRQGMGLRPH